MPLSPPQSISSHRSSPPGSSFGGGGRHGPLGSKISIPLGQLNQQQTPYYSYPSGNQQSNLANSQNPNHPEYLEWRRLHLSRAKLSGITEIAALMAGFSVVATVELQINDDAHPIMLTAFTVTTALLVCTTMLSIMIATCILPHVTVVAKMEDYLRPRDSPHDSMMSYIDLAWLLANTFSIFLFVLDVILLCWVKFTYFSVTASICATVIMIPILLAVCVFGVLFYRNITTHQSIVSDRKVEELEEYKKELDRVSSLAVSSSNFNLYSSNVISV